MFSSPGIYQAPANLDTGEVGEFKRIWNGTGGMVRSSIAYFQEKLISL